MKKTLYNMYESPEVNCYGLSLDGFLCSSKVKLGVDEHYSRAGDESDDGDLIFD